ncbi:MAG: TlpA family protein disulfide reductase [Thermoplasmatota archaeon]
MRVVVLLLAATLAGCASPQDPLSDGISQAEREAYAAFAPEPLTGHGKNLTALEGNATLVFIWASWCGVCKADEPTLREIHAEYAPQGFEIMAVSRESSRSAALDYAESQDWAFPAYWSRSAPEDLGLRDYQPGYMLFDRSGEPTWSAERGLRGSGFDTLRMEIEAVL